MSGSALLDARGHHSRGRRRTRRRALLPAAHPVGELELAPQGGHDHGLQLHPRGAQRRRHQPLREPVDSRVSPRPKRPQQSWTMGRIYQLHIHVFPIKHSPVLIKAFASNFTAVHTVRASKRRTRAEGGGGAGGPGGISLHEEKMTNFARWPGEAGCW